MKKAKEQGNAWLNGAKNDAEHLDGVKKETPGTRAGRVLDAIKSMAARSRRNEHEYGFGEKDLFHPA